MQEVKLKVIDNDGLSDEDITYAIVNITPVADAGGTISWLCWHAPYI